MSEKPKLEPNLIAWINWLVSEEEAITDLTQLEGSKKMEKLIEKLITEEELRPKSDDSLVYLYAIIMILIKRYDVGPNAFKNQISNNDVKRNYTIIALHMWFLYYCKVQKNKPEVAGQWWEYLSQRFEIYSEMNKSNTKEYNLDICIQCANDENSKCREELDGLEQKIKGKNKDIQKRKDEIHQMYEEKITKLTVESLAAEKDIKIAKEEAEKFSEEYQKHIDVINEIKHKESEMSKLDDDYAEIMEELKLKKKEEESYNRKLAELTLYERSDGFNSLDEVIENKKKELAELEAPLQREEIDLSELEYELEKLKSENNSIDVDAVKQEKVKEITDQIQECEKKLQFTDSFNNLGRLLEKMCK